MKGCGLKKYNKIITFCMLLFVMVVLVGCKLEETTEEKIKDLDYTICDEGKVPKGLYALIEQKKKEPFKLTYTVKDYMYIVIGYGAQDRMDLSIQLKELYLSENAIFVRTQLVSEREERLGKDKVAYPVIVVKCERHDVAVIFK